MIFHLQAFEATHSSLLFLPLLQLRWKAKVVTTCFHCDWSDLWPLNLSYTRSRRGGKWHQIADTFEMKRRICKCHPVAHESLETPHQSVSQSGRFRIYSPQSDVYSPLPFLNECLAITPSLTAENYCLLNEELTFHSRLALPSFKLGTCMWFNLPHCLTPDINFLHSFNCSPGKSAVEVEDSRKWEGRGWMRLWGWRRDIKWRQVEKWKAQVSAIIPTCRNHRLLQQNLAVS